ncbi:MAG: DEAD/DEAH box helicase family protein [Gemmataceae bacterium]|nr:DEAD/DEAH box helicase family protein [Gemmataceae bacterium]
MELKRYQVRVVQEVKHFLEKLAEHRAAGARHPSLDAWAEAKRVFPIAGTYQERKNGVGDDLPTFCIKVPTGGGKTLLATHILAILHETILTERNGAGLVLWVVPSDQIYKDTLAALRDRRHPYREALEFALSRRLEVWEKQDVLRLTPGQLAANLNILLIKLPSTNRQDRESLKFFRDSGGNIVMHFPPEDQPEEHGNLKQRVPNLEMLGDGPDALVKTSLANLVRLCQPAVILDEGHRATTQQARTTIEGFNPAIVVELSATPPKGANVLVRVSGQELLEEQMIKLPLNISASSVKSWKDCLAHARDKRLELAELASRHWQDSGHTIRPIVLVQVERTGKDQRDSTYVHSEDVKVHLMERLNVTKEAIAIKSSEKDDIEGLNLLDEGCPIEWIITKSALQEGWDCPFAYILVSLNNTASQQSMTQLVGRVLRQPDVTRTAYEGLNESYVFCLRKKAADISKEVKKALEKEGYEREAASLIAIATDASAPPKRTLTIRDHFRRIYRHEFEGKIYLPVFCVKNGNGKPERLDYFRHLISQVEVEDFDYAGINWDLRAELAAATDQHYRLTLGQEVMERVSEAEAAVMETDEQVKRWLAANLDYDYYSLKQMLVVVERAMARLAEINADLAGKLGLVKFIVREKLGGLVDRETDRLTEAAFKRLFETKKLCFYLLCEECRFQIPESVEIRPTKSLYHANADQVSQSLYDYVDDDLNEYERSVALFLDRHPQVLWWYRNLVGRENFAIQGFRRQQIFPDFVVQEGKENGQKRKPIARVLVLDSKGSHLKGSEDTSYKRKVADYFEKVGKKVTWQKLGEEFESHQFRFQILDEGDYEDRDWRDELKRQLEAPLET